MEIVVCIKQIPDSRAQVQIDPTTNTVIRQNLPTMVNLFDKNAVEAAIQLKEKHGGKVTLISMGPPYAREALEECLAMGADNAIHISDEALAGTDTLGTAYTLAAAIRKLGKYDVIICGKHSLDSSTGNVGPEIAEHLGLPQVTCVANLEVDGDIATAEREHDGRYEVIEVKLPALFTVVKAINEPRWATIEERWNAIYDDIPIWTLHDLNIPEERFGLKGSPTQVRKIVYVPPRSHGILIKKNSPQETVDELMRRIVEAKIVISGR